MAHRTRRRSLRPSLGDRSPSVIAALVAISSASRSSERIPVAAARKHLIRRFPAKLPVSQGISYLRSVPLTNRVTNKRSRDVSTYAFQMAPTSLLVFYPWSLSAEFLSLVLRKVLATSARRSPKIAVDTKRSKNTETRLARAVRRDRLVRAPHSCRAFGDRVGILTFHAF